MQDSKRNLQINKSEPLQSLLVSKPQIERIFQNSERSSRKIRTSRKDSLATIPKKTGVYKNRTRELKEEVDEEEEGSVEDNAEATLVKKRLKVRTLHSFSLDHPNPTTLLFAGIEGSKELTPG